MQSHPALRMRQAGPEESALRREQSHELQALLAGLASESRNAVILRYWYDWSYEEIAAATGATVSSVKSRLHRARVALGELLNARPLGEVRRLPAAGAMSPRPSAPRAATLAA